MADGAKSRGLSLAELLIGAAIVVAHNVFRLVPNEVPILAILALMSMRIRCGRWDWSYLGFRKPQSWSRLLLIALLAAALRIGLGDWLIEPVTQHFWPPIKAPEGTDDIEGHFNLVLLYLPAIWGFAAFGEEIDYRGYLLNRGADCGGGSKRAYGAALLVSSVLFGFGHYYKGAAGVADSTVAGLILGGAYLSSGRNVWTCIFAHGFIDTIGLVSAYFGWDR